MKKNNLLEGAYYSKEPLFAQIDEIMKYFDEDGNIISDDLNIYQIDFLNKLKEEFAANYKLQNENNTINIKENINKLVDNFYKEFGLENIVKPGPEIFLKLAQGQKILRFGIKLSTGQAKNRENVGHFYAPGPPLAQF